jgi:dienelactone hydrolase
MTTIALFHSVLGVRQGVLDAAARLREDGHEVLVADLYDGRTFDTYEPALEFAHHEVGHEELLRRADAAVSGLGEGFVTFGFSLGCVMAVHVATRRQVSGVVMVAGAIPVSAFGPDVLWPQGVPAQTHATLDDPWRDEDEVRDAVRDVAAGGAVLEVVDYPGSGHLFTDPTLPDEYDPVATEDLWARVLPFVRACGEPPGAGSR